jgi:hypothetical protein
MKTFEKLLYMIDAECMAKRYADTGSEAFVSAIQKKYANLKNDNSPYADFYIGAFERELHRQREGQKEIERNL